MKIRTLLLLTALGAMAVFVALNWSAFMTPANISLGIAEVRAPLGLIMLGMMLFLLSLFLIFAVYMQASLLFDTRRTAREMQAVRELADQAESSRFSELRGFLEAELNKLAERDAESRAAVLARVEQLDHDLRKELEEQENTLSAYIGELEERLEKTSG